MLRSTTVALALAMPALAQAPIAAFAFEDGTLSSPQPAFAAVSDLALSHGYTIGGVPGDRRLCLTTDWDANGGTVSFTVTPFGGQAIRYERLCWQTRAADPAASDSVAAVTVRANGATIGTVDPLQADGVHDLDLGRIDALRGQTAPVTFVFDFVGDPAGQSAHEIAELSLLGSLCAFAITGVQPASLPTVTADSFLIDGPGMDTVVAVRFGNLELEPRTPGVFGTGSWEVPNPCTLFVRPPLCLPPGAYPIEVTSSCGTETVDVTLTAPTAPTLVGEPSHPAGAQQCFVFHAGGPGPQVLILVASPVLVPSVAPGLVELGIGDMFGNLFTTFFVADCATWCLPVPASRAGDTWHFQGVVWHSSNLELTQELATTGVCTASWY